MQPAILTINAGSSSIKFAAFALAGAAEPALLLRGQIEGIGTAPRFRAQDAAGRALPGPGRGAPQRHAEAIDQLLDWLAAHSGGLALFAAGHRVVHGGSEFAAPVLVTREILAALAALSPLAPHHQPHNVAAIAALAERRPDLPQVACFDTAFHATQPEIARRLPLPREMWDAGLRRYGFHGLSYEYIVGALPGVAGALPGRLVVLHLGNGASLCAIRDGRSVATSMGFSTLDGLMMGTRCGALDPGVILFLMRERGLDLQGLTDLLYNRSGLLGTSGISSDMRTLLASDAPAAREAVDLYCYRAVRELGSAAAALGGLDAVVFTGGVGENAAPVRAAIARGAAHLGLALDEAANEGGGPRISRADSRVAAWAIPTNEELMIARHVRDRVQAGADTPQGCIHNETN